jgi:cytochrome c oxidase assembly factor CtaG
MGLAVALSRTAPPATDSTGGTVKELLGYDMPPPITAVRLLTLWRFDFFFALLIVVLAGLYLAGVVRLRRRGDRWPAGRTAAWFVGLLSIASVTLSGVATYAPVLFSVHMAQHMVMAMLTPIFLVLGAPVTLALRALKPAAIRGDRGPREWLTVFLHSRVTKVVTHPAVATAVFIVSTYALYFSPLFEKAMRAHLGHIAMLTHFLLSGILFFWVLIGVDPAPIRLPYIGRLLVLFVTMPFHAFFGIAIMNMGKPLAEGWYTTLDRPWGASLVSDQSTGGAMAWAFGEIPTFIVLIALVFQWFVEDERLARRLERKADRAEVRKEDSELSDYNAYLESLSKRPGRKAAAPAPSRALETRGEPEPDETVAEASDSRDSRE